MDTSTTISIMSYIVIPVIVALITGYCQAKKYKKEIELLNVAHEQKVQEQKSEYEHQIDMLKLEQQHRQELEAQKVGNDILEKMTEKLTDEIIKQPATQKMINQKTNRSFLNKKK